MNDYHTPVFLCSSYTTGYCYIQTICSLIHAFIRISYAFSTQEALIPGMKEIEMKDSVLVRDIQPWSERPAYSWLNETAGNLQEQREWNDPLLVKISCRSVIDALKHKDHSPLTRKDGHELTNQRREKLSYNIGKWQWQWSGMRQGTQQIFESMMGNWGLGIPDM